MSNAAFRDMNRRTYIQWAFEIGAATAALIWWQWRMLAIWWTPERSAEARAVALARIARLFLPPPMLDRATIVVDQQGHVNTAAAILDAIQSHGAAYATLRTDAWVYLLLPPSAGLLAAAILLYAAHRIRTARERRAQHVRGASIDDHT